MVLITPGAEKRFDLVEPALRVARYLVEAAMHVG